MINRGFQRIGCAVLVSAALAWPAAGAVGAAVSVDDLTSRYGAGMTAEIRRLRLHSDQEVFTVFDAGVGYVQCLPLTSPAAIYCEAESTTARPALTSVLTPPHVAQLHAAGYADPGSAPNYSKTSLAGQADDAAIARELLTILHDVYGYDGAAELEVETETGGQ